jgi:hypothetical protein
MIAFVNIHKEGGAKLSIVFTIALRTWAHPKNVREQSLSARLSTGV